MTNKFLILLILAIPFLSCKKECAEPTYGVPGLYEGTFSYSPGTIIDYPQYFSYSLLENGNIYAESNDRGNWYYATGTWKKNGNIIESTYTYKNSQGGPSVQTSSVTFDPKGKLVNGTWYNPAINQRGTFEMTRKK
jgi:hypothetical protein